MDFDIIQTWAIIVSASFSSHSGQLMRVLGLLLLLWGPEFGYCLVYSLLYQKSTQHTYVVGTHSRMCTACCWTKCTFVACASLFVLPPEFCSFLLSSASRFFLPADRTNSWCLYFTITQLLSCMSGSVPEAELVLHNAGLDRMGKVPRAADWGCCWRMMGGWGCVCWLMCRRASRR